MSLRLSRDQLGLESLGLAVLIPKLMHLCPIKAIGAPRGSENEEQRMGGVALWYGVCIQKYYKALGLIPSIVRDPKGRNQSHVLCRQRYFSTKAKKIDH